MKQLLTIIFLVSLIANSLFAQESTFYRPEKVEARLLGANYLSFDYGAWGMTYYEGERRIRKRSFLQKLQTHPVAYTKYKKALRIKTVGNVIGIPAGLLCGFTLGKQLMGGRPNHALLIPSGIVSLGCATLLYISHARMKKAVSLFNNNELTTWDLSLGASARGVGITLRF